eukprot:TRINITY_DN245_c0_g1_i2.p1 TRINITY_DN245_c0_g1~~TRINITY_DN245_c0_g1_i2.p1  ORF type:complete len:135 (-),score=11.86 TRINITY_DN245_c0_g1_i2:8-412(-)
MAERSRMDTQSDLKTSSPGTHTRSRGFNIYHSIQTRECHGYTYKKSTPNIIRGNEIFIRRLKLQTTLNTHEGCVNTIRWNENGTRLVSGSDDTSICVWDIYGAHDSCKLKKRFFRAMIGTSFVLCFYLLRMTLR